MNINALGQITHNTNSFWEEYNQIMNQTNEGILYTFKNHSDELQHIAYFIDAIDS